MSAEPPPVPAPPAFFAGHAAMLARRTAGGLTLAVIALAGMVLIGWLAGSQSLVSSGSSGATMKFNTAVSLILLAVAVLILSLTTPRGRAGVAVIACAACAGALAGIALVEYVADTNIGIDELVVSDPAGAGGLDRPGRMAPQTAASIVLVAVGVLLQGRGPYRAGLGRWVAAAGVIAPVVGLFQHASGISTFFTVPGVVQMALSTCVAFIALIAALMLSAPAHMPVAALLSSGPGGAMLRRVLPAAVLIPFGAGIVAVQGLRLDLYGQGVAVLLVVSATALVGGAVTWLVARGLDAVDGERRRTERRLQASEVRLRTLLEQAPVGIYEADPSGARLYVNERWSEVAGVAPDHALDDTWLDAVHPDDRERVRAAWSQALRDRTELRARFRYLRPDGTVAWVDGLATPVEAGGETDTGWIGSELDITARVSQENELRARERIATTAARDGDPDEVFAVVAEETARIVGCDFAAVVRADAGVGVVVGAWGRHPRAGRVVGARISLTAADGAVRTVRDGPPELPYRSSIVAPVRVGERVWGALVLGNLRPGPFPPEERARLERFAGLIALALVSADAHRRLRNLVVTDHLTGLPNTRAFHERLTDEVALAHRHERPLSLVMIDIDHFKGINDGHGHPVGDAVLRALVARMAAEVRAGEMLARVGGEEFAWLMPENDIAGAHAAAERMREAVSARPVAPAGIVTVSAGISQLAPDETPDDLVRRADIALYAAKDGGRDLVVAHAGDAGS